MKYLGKSLKNTCEEVFLENVVDSQPEDLLNNGLLNTIFLRTLIKLSKDLLNQKLWWLFRLCDKISRWY